MATLQAIKDHGLIFVSAQPDQTYFHWQVELYLYQFAKHGIQDHCYALFGYTDKPSEYAKGIAAKFKNVLFYKDTRKLSIPNFYIPSIRPHILKQFFAEYPHLGRNVFYHDSDIFLVKLPAFEALLDDTNAYVSDTISYIGHDYIASCDKKYKEKYPELAENAVLTKMCDAAGISVDLVKENQPNSGGAQYLLKGIDAAFWEEVEPLCQTLYSLTKEHEAKYPIRPKDIQSWTADMWAVLWAYLKRGKQVRVHRELDFSWAVYGISDYFSKNIFHLAGVTGESCSDKFFKGMYINKNVFKEYMKDPTIFDHISTTSSTYEYVKVIKEYATGLPPPAELSQTRFLLKSSDPWSAIYRRDETKKIMNEYVWRAVDKPYILFNNGSSWIITPSQYEGELGKGSGGLVFNTSDVPYDGWKNCTVELLDIVSAPVETTINVPSGKYAGLYMKSADILGKSAWKSDKFVIFNNGRSWILTSVTFIDTLTLGSGGFMSTKDDPTTASWVQ